jgi:hypothetical protein
VTGQYERLRQAVTQVLDAEIGDDAVALRRLLWDALNQESESLEAPQSGARVEESGPAGTQRAER